MAKHGGARAGAGRPKGSEEQATIDKRTNRALIRAAVTPHIEKLVNSHVANACGVSFMRLRYPDGRFANATDEKQIDAAIAAGASWFEIFTQQPHQASASMLLAYAADKPVEPVEVSGEGGGPVVVKWAE